MITALFHSSGSFSSFHMRLHNLYIILCIFKSSYFINSFGVPSDPEAFQFFSRFIALIISFNDISLTSCFNLWSSQPGSGVAGIFPFRNSSKYSCHLDAFICGSNNTLLCLSFNDFNIGLNFCFFFYCCKEISDFSLCVILLCVKPT